MRAQLKKLMTALNLWGIVINIMLIGFAYYHKLPDLISLSLLNIALLTSSFLITDIQTGDKK